ncbi:MAG: glycerophosphodiester phosphodiesterase family protein, partial [Steroidobacteraceae bacterium]
MYLLDLARRTRGDFARRWRVVFGWQLLVQLFGFIAAAPLAGALADRVVARSGSDVVSNYDIAKFVLSLPGAIFIVLAVVATIAVQTSQLAGYAWISGHVIGHGSVTLLGTIGAVAQKLRLLVRVGARVFVRVVVLALPFLAILAFVWFATLAGRDVNYYLAEHPPEWRRALLVAIVCGAGYGFVLLAQFARWLFTMPIAMFHDLSPAQVLRASERMLEGRLVRSIAPLLLWWLLLAGLAALCLRAGRIVTSAAMDWAGVDPQRVLPLVAVFMAVTIAFGFVYATLQFAGLQFLATRMYADRREAPLLLGDAADAVAEQARARAGRPLVFTAVIMAALALLVGAYLLQRLDVPEDVAVTAHRGASLQAPENTMAAFRAAHAAGADYVELDVQRTHDGAIVVFHDGDLLRMGGDARKVKDLTLDEITAIDIGVRRGSAHAGEKVPTLAEVIDYARGKFRINIELKYNVPDPGLAPAVIELVRSMDFLDQVVITSLDHASLRQVEKIMPSLDTGLIVTAAVGNVTRTDTDFVSLNSARATATLIDQARAAGKQVHVWTVNKPEVMLRMIERDVDNIITDDPALLVGVMRDRNALTP